MKIRLRRCVACRVVEYHFHLLFGPSSPAADATSSSSKEKRKNYENTKREEIRICPLRVQALHHIKLCGCVICRQVSSPLLLCCDFDINYSIFNFRKVFFFCFVSSTATPTTIIIVCVYMVEQVLNMSTRPIVLLDTHSLLFNFCYFVSSIKFRRYVHVLLLQTTSLNTSRRRVIPYKRFGSSHHIFLALSRSFYFILSSSKCDYRIARANASN